VDSGVKLVPCSRMRVRSPWLLFFLFVGVLSAQERLLGPLDLNRTVVLRGQTDRRALARFDQGAVAADFQVPYVTMLLKPSGSQQADLDRLLSEQQDRSSSNYHRWLTPQQFADRFGLSNGDISTLVGWLNSQGMRVQDVARGRHWITFSGSAADIGRAFRTQIHRYRVNGRDHFANATELSIPAAFENVVGGLVGLSDFYRTPRPLMATPEPWYNSSHGTHYLAPADFATIYDIHPLYDSGIDGTGQSIAIVGSSDIFPSDITTFRSKFGLPANNPRTILYGPDPGFNFGSMFEADLDLEWSGAVAPRAKIIYVNAISPFLAAQYAIDTDVAPILSMSSGYCEPGLTPALRILGQQANAQGITWMASSGDSGGAACDSQDDFSQAGKGLGVNIPASLPEVTGIGGTTFDEGADTYWADMNGTGLGSALSYIPEVAWNDTLNGGPLGATGGGASIYFDKPLWQTASGVPNDGARDVPDVSLSASAAHDPYLVTSLGGLYAVGGTSASAPAFAGMVALLSHYLTSKGETQSGLGNINPRLYRLSQTAPIAFHDITAGDNLVPCVQASPNCSNGLLGYHAAPGYDRVTGLGSVDLNNLVTQWKTGPASSTTLSASPRSIAYNGGTIRLTATVNASGGTPTGAVTFQSSEISFGTAALVLSGGQSTATLAVDANQFLLGAHSVTAVYSGDNVWDGSAGSTTVTVTIPASGAAISPAIFPNPVLEQPPDADGLRWHATLVLTEEAGVGATVTGLSANGVSYDSQLATIFKTTTIPPHGTLTGTLGFATLPSPATQTFVFTGQDADGANWTVQANVQFVSTMEVSRGLALASTPGTIVQNASNPSCPWSQQLTVQEQGGNYVGLTRLAMGVTDLSDKIQQIFGTTRLAPFSTLYGTLCRSDVHPPETQYYELMGVTELGQRVTAKLTSTFQAANANPAGMSVLPASVAIPVATSSASGSSSIALSFTDGIPDWSVSLLPSSQTTGWLTVSPLSGTGPTQLAIQAAPGGLAKGVYTATLVIQAVNASPQFIDVPVTLLVGDTSQIQIGGVSNAASFQTAFAPGMLMSVYGVQLAPAGSAQLAGALPLPLNLAGVSATVNGLTAPLYYISPGQLNVQVPYETSAGTAILGVNNNGQVASFPFQVSAVAPGIFTDMNGALVPYGSGTVGQTLLIFITGSGDLAPNLPTGYTPPAQTPVASLPRTVLPVTVTVGGIAADVKFAGVSYGLVGVTQINFVVPQGVPAGQQPVVVSVGGVAAPAATLTVTE
jgi:uncharacterized protein (TIGR03437 family)